MKSEAEIRARLEETYEIRFQYHHIEESERLFAFVQFMDKRVSELERELRSLAAQPVLSPEVVASIEQGRADARAGNARSIEEIRASLVHPPATVDAAKVPPIPKCPQCGDKATYQTPDGTFWDSNAHYWRLPARLSSTVMDEEKVKELATAANVFGARVKERDPSTFDSEWGTDFAEARDRLAAALVACGFKFAALLPDEGKRE